MRNKRWINEHNEGMTGRRIRKVLVAAFAAASLMMAVPVGASEAPTEAAPSATPASETTVTPTNAASGNEILPVADAPATNTFTLQFTYHPDGTTSVPISGAEFTIFKVADLQVKDQVATYAPVDGFKSVASYESKTDPNALSYEGMTASESLTAAKALAAEVGSASGEKGTTDAAGSYKYENLAPGMYLVMQTGKTGMADLYKTLDPFLVQVPTYFKNEAGDQYEWNADVIASPKPETELDITSPPRTSTTTTPRQSRTTTTPTTTKKPTKKPTATPKKSNTTVRRTTTTNRTSTVKTGDRQPIVFWFGIACLAMAIILIVVNRRRKV